MNYSDEIELEISKYTQYIDPIIIENIRLAERIKIFSKLRELIDQKNYKNDQIASDVLGWAYERLSED